MKGAFTALGSRGYLPTGGSVQRGKRTHDRSLLMTLVNQCLRLPHTTVFVVTTRSQSCEQFGLLLTGNWLVANTFLQLLQRGERF